MQHALIRDDLTPVLRDLTPVLATTNVPVPATTSHTGSALTSSDTTRFVPGFLSTNRRQHPWYPDDTVVAAALLGDVVLDYTQAHWPAAKSELAVAVIVGLGDVKLIVPHDVKVRLDHTVPVLGDVKVKGAAATPKTRALTISGVALLADIKVEYR